MATPPERLSTSGLEAAGGAGCQGGVCPASQSQLSAGLWHISHMQSPGVNEVTQRSPEKNTRSHCFKNKAGLLQAHDSRCFCVCVCVCVRRRRAVTVETKWKREGRTDTQSDNTHQPLPKKEKKKRTIHLCYIINRLTEQTWRYWVHRVLECSLAQTQDQKIENHHLSHQEEKLRMTVCIMRQFSLLVSYKSNFVCLHWSKTCCKSVQWNAVKICNVYDCKKSKMFVCVLHMWLLSEFQNLSIIHDSRGVISHFAFNCRLVETSAPSHTACSCQSFCAVTLCPNSMWHNVGCSMPTWHLSEVQHVRILVENF